MGSAKSYNKVIKIARIANNYSMKEVAELSGISSPYICSLENGNRKVTSNVLEKLAKVYNLEPYQLMELVEYYEGLEADESVKYKLTLLKTLEIVLVNSTNVP